MMESTVGKVDRTNCYVRSFLLIAGSYANSFCFILIGRRKCIKQNL